MRAPGANFLAQKPRKNEEGGRPEIPILTTFWPVFGTTLIFKNPKIIPIAEVKKNRKNTRKYHSFLGPSEPPPGQFSQETFRVSESALLWHVFELLRSKKTQKRPFWRCHAKKTTRKTHHRDFKHPLFEHSCKNLAFPVLFFMTIFCDPHFSPPQNTDWEVILGHYRGPGERGEMRSKTPN